METIAITGGRGLQGCIRPAAAKNSVLPLLAAALLCGEPCAVSGVPPLADVATSLALLRAVGAAPELQGDTIRLAPRPLCGDIPPAVAGAMRASVFYLAPLLIRAGAVTMPLPGGCRLGPRPIDIHLDGLAAMGASVQAGAQAVTLRRRGALHAVDYTLRLPSVGATLTLLMAAACAEGYTTLRGVAREPEIQDVAAFLKAGGAEIAGAAPRGLTSRGAGGLLPGGARHTPLPDRIAAATYASAVAIAGGQVTVEGCPPGHLGAFLQFLRRVGCRVTPQGGGFAVQRDPGRPLRGGVRLCTAAWPGFATDTAPLAAAVLLFAEGESAIHDALFQNRFACAEGFRALGAQVRAEGRDLAVRGGRPLHGAGLTAPDLRGGAALVLAALGAQGESLLRDAGHIRRGYADLPADLARLGACCRRLDDWNEDGQN